MEYLWNKTCLEQPTVHLSSDSRFLTSLWVSGKDKPPENLSQSIATGLELKAVEYFSWNQEIKYKIKAVLKRLAFREQHVLVQFWSPRVVGKHQLLTTVDQPFGFGVVVDKLCYYRKDSEYNAYLVDAHSEEDDHSPPARVFRRGLPERTLDITNYNPIDFPQYELAISCNLHGYMALPVVDSTTGVCVGVLELLMSSNYTSYAFEVQQVHRALKAENLTSPQVFDHPTLNVPTERRQNELHEIMGILKDVSDIHNLPLAQTWAISPTSSFVSHENVIIKSCSSFDTRCIGKECITTTALPFHVRDLGKWEFREACTNQHLDKSRGFIGQALLTHGSGYCEDVTELSEEEYPLVHYARVSGLATCFTLFLHSVEGDDDYHDYVLEFFLMLDDKDRTHVMSLVQTLKQRVEVVSGFELGEVSTTEVIGPPRDNTYLSSSINPYGIPISSITMESIITSDKDSSDSETFLANISKREPVNGSRQWLLKQNDAHKQSVIITNTESFVKNDVKSGDVSVVGSRKYPRLKQGRKCKKNLLTMKSLEKHIEKPINQAAESLGVSRSTLKRFCREHGISSWPVPKRSKTTGCVIDAKVSQKLCSEKHMQTSSSPCSAVSRKNFGIYQVTRLVLSLRRWKNRTSNRNAIGNPALCINIGNQERTKNIFKFHMNVDDQQLSNSNLVHAPLKQSVSNVLDNGMLIVKATFKNDMIKFRFHVSSGLLELENEVARRVNVEGKRLSIRYKNKDNDLVHVTCDADLHAFFEFLESNSTIKLQVELAND